MQIRYNIYKEKMIVFITGFIAVFTHFTLFLNHSYTSDHIGGYFNNFSFEKPDFVSYVNGGRFVTYFLAWFQYFTNKFHISKFENEYVFQILLMLELAICVLILYEIFKDYFGLKYKSIILPLILALQFANSFSAELFNYVAFENGVGVILACLGVKCFSKKRYLLSSIFVFGCLSIYQSYVAIFMILACTYLYVEDRGDFQFKRIWDYVKVAACSCIPAILNIIIAQIPKWNGVYETETKVVASLGESDPINRIGNMISAYKFTIWKCLGQYPKGFIFGVIVLLFVCMVWLLLKEKKKILDFVYFVVVFSLLNIFYVLIFAVEANPWPAQRVVWPVFCTVSGLMLCVSSHMREELHKKFLYGFLIVFYLINIYYVQTSTMDLYISNKLDIYTMNTIQEEIEYYEETSGNKVDLICTRKGNELDYFYEGYLNLNYPMVTYAHKIYWDVWCDVEFLNAITKNQYEEREMTDEEFKKYFLQDVGDCFAPSRQLRFVENTLYWVIE